MADLIGDKSDAAVNFDYDQIADGFGLETYYLYARIEASGNGTETTTYHLTKDPTIASDAIDLLITSAGALGSCSGAISAYTQLTQTTFTSPTLRLPKVINGTAIIDFTYTFREDSATPATFYPSVAIYHYDGLTETQLGSTWYGRSTTSSSNSEIPKRAVAHMALGRKKFRKGDAIRVKIGGAICGGSGTFDRASFGIDPLNRDGTSINPSTDDPVSTTIFKVRLPFEVST